MNEVRDRLAEVEHRIAVACASAGRARESVRLIAVSKKQPVERVLAAYEAGCRDFGENYVQELERRQHELASDVRLHMIGHVQTNKAKRAATASMVHTLDSVKLARALVAGRVAAKPLEVLIEVNSGDEGTKSGLAPDAVEALLAEVEGVEVVGLMCIPPPHHGRRHFAALRELRDRLRASTGRVLPELSMGMSSDFEDAILEGATLVRVGTSIFGERVAG